MLECSLHFSHSFLLNMQNHGKQARNGIKINWVLLLTEIFDLLVQPCSCCKWYHKTSTCTGMTSYIPFIGGFTFDSTFRWTLRCSVEPGQRNELSEIHKPPNNNNNTNTENSNNNLPTFANSRQGVTTGPSEQQASSMWAHYYLWETILFSHWW